MVVSAAVSRKRAGSQRWLDEHARDPYVRRAHEKGLRSRASFKLAELDERFRLFRPGAVVVDLGAAPGGWSQVAAERVQPGGRVIALDILPMEPLPGVETLQGDFREAATLEALEGLLGERPATVVLSDMAPNITGVRDVDQPRSMHLAELALDLAERLLEPQGDMLVKVFQGEGFDAFLSSARARFERVSMRKPGASRARSREQYLLARGFRGDAG